MKLSYKNTLPVLPSPKDLMYFSRDSRVEIKPITALNGVICTCIYIGHITRYNVVNLNDSNGYCIVSDINYTEEEFEKQGIEILLDKNGNPIPFKGDI